MLHDERLAELDERLAPVDAALRRHYPGEPPGGSRCTPSTCRPTGYEAGLPAA